jgi:hypothetical protein
VTPVAVLDRVRWYVREATGEGRWERYLEQCRAEGREPLSRRDYERCRSDHRDAHPEGRCC